MNGSQLLHEARILVDKGWCQGTEARDSGGGVTAVDGPDAVAWSLLGALQATTVSDPSTQISEIGDAVTALAELIADPSLANWNDSETRTKLEVLTLLDDAEVLAFQQVIYRDISDN